MRYEKDQLGEAIPLHGTLRDTLANTCCVQKVAAILSTMLLTRFF